MILTTKSSTIQCTGMLCFSHWYSFSDISFPNVRDLCVNNKTWHDLIHGKFLRDDGASSITSICPKKLVFSVAVVTTSAHKFFDDIYNLRGWK